MPGLVLFGCYYPKKIGNARLIPFIKNQLQSIKINSKEQQQPQYDGIELIRIVLFHCKYFCN